MGVRGYEWGVYVDDDGTQWSKLVDADNFSDPGRGWVLITEGVWTPLPRGWKARRVIGLDESGRKQMALVARVDSPLWTGESSTFTVEASDGTVVTATVISRHQERHPRPPMAAPAP